jgi:hypothetical protein
LASAGTLATGGAEEARAVLSMITDGHQWCWRSAGNSLGASDDGRAEFSVVTARYDENLGVKMW